MILLSISPFIFIQCGSGLFALPQHLPQSRHRAAELFLAAGVSRHQPKKYSKRS